MYACYKLNVCLQIFGSRVLKIFKQRDFYNLKLYKYCVIIIIFVYFCNLVFNLVLSKVYAI